jgi:RNA polymerase sigma factor (sigma-70 family)
MEFLKSGIDERIRQRNLTERIVTLSSCLDTKDRTIVLMRFRGGYAYAEIASLLNVHYTTVSRRVKRILRTIAKFRRL